MLPRSPSTTSPCFAATIMLSALLLLGATCGPATTAVDGGAQERGAFASPDCDVASIEDLAGGVTCARCEGPSGTAEICGVVEVARCESREDSRGQPCSFCATDAGEILFDSCFSDDLVPSVNCERSQEPAAPEGEADLGGDFVCETCTDADGLVVASSCEPESDECHEEDNNGVRCRVCTRGNDVVVRSCEQPDITPRSCEAYGDLESAGRCVDCYSARNELLSHSCTFANDPFVSCNESITSEGLRCFACVDANGAQVERSCEGVTPELKQCALLDYSDQSCVVCIDERGGTALLDCDRNDCTDDDDQCPAPPSCTLELGPRGELCRTCPTDQGVLEQACVVDTNLVCGEVFDTFTGGSCLVCSDLSSGVEVYRRCGDGDSLPPTCFLIENGTNETCEVCTDSQTGELIYADCPSQTCSDIGDFSLFAAQGDSLFLDQQPAVASCTQCATAGPNGATFADDFRASCSLLPDCPVDLANPDSVCQGTARFLLRPRLCDNPWQGAGYVGSPDSYDELLQILAFALDGSLQLVAVQHAPGAPSSSTCNDTCGCDREGARIEIVARPGDAARVVELFGAVIEGCASDFDCREGGVCRSDGACG